MSDRTKSTYGERQGQRDELVVVVATVNHQRQKYEGILPSTISWDDFRNAFLTAVQSNYRLLKADRQSLWLALQKAAGDGLKPDGREGALVIFGDDEEDEAGNRVPSKANQKKKFVWMPMIRGLIKLIRNTGNVASIHTPLRRGWEPSSDCPIKRRCARTKPSTSLPRTCAGVSARSC